MRIVAILVALVAAAPMIAAQENTSNNTSGQMPPSITPPPASNNTTTPVSTLEADIWAETWQSKTIDIHRVDPDGFRANAKRAVKMYTNFSVQIYAKNTSAPFHYRIWIDDIKVDEGDATWHYSWSTQTTESAFNLTVSVTQGSKERNVGWARIVATPKSDSGIGEEGEGDTEGNKGTEEVPIGYIGKLTWKVVIASAAQVAVAMVLVGGIWLEKQRRTGWTRMK